MNRPLSALSLGLFAWAAVACSGPTGEDTPTTQTAAAETPAATASQSSTPRGTRPPSPTDATPAVATPTPPRSPAPGTPTAGGPRPSPSLPQALTPTPATTPTLPEATAGQTPWDTTPTAPCVGEACIFEPMDPAELAPPPAPAVVSQLAEAVSFLFEGEDAPQQGVSPGAIDADRLAVVRGRVLGDDGSPLEGVWVRVVDHPELGRTFTRADGRYDLAVNGGSWLALDFQRPGYTRGQRRVHPGWEGIEAVPDLRLLPLDPVANPIDLIEAVEVARGSVVEDADGRRQATLLFPREAGARAVLPDGGSVELPTFTVRATEFTVGDGGPAAMPGSLPVTSGYTYAVDLSVDEAAELGAVTVRFDAPVSFYVEDFLDFPVGGKVPVGYYDYQRAAWIPSPDGRIVEILGAEGGLATLDVDGSGAPASPEALSALGVTDDERARLTQLYTAGQRLWRVPLTHLTPYDCNWPYGPPRDATAPDGSGIGGGAGGGGANKRKDPCPEEGSILLCQSQTLGERIPLVGIPGTLNHRSDRMPGWVAGRRLSIPLTTSDPPPSLTGVTVKVTVGDAVDEATYPATPDLVHTFTWDGLLYGQPFYGALKADVSLSYLYPAAFYTPSELPLSFGAYGSDVTVIGDREAGTYTLGAGAQVPLEHWGPETWPVAGWTLSFHHLYDPVTKTIFYGDGRQRPGRAVVQTLSVAAGIAGSCCQNPGDGGPATEALLGQPYGLAAGLDGALYIADWKANRVRRVGPDGIITTIAGALTQGYNGDGIPATKAQLAHPADVAVDPLGRVYIADLLNDRIRRVELDGTIVTVVGSGDRGFSGDGGPATAAALYGPRAIALDAEGALYIVDGGNARVRKVSVDGIITTIAGDGSVYYSDGEPREGQLASESPVPGPTYLEVDRDGALLISTGPYLYRVGGDGILRILAGGGKSTDDGIPATQAQLTVRGFGIDQGGAILLADSFSDRLRRIGPDGLITTVAGTGVSGTGGMGGAAKMAQLSNPEGVLIHPDGRVYISSQYTVVRLAPPVEPYDEAEGLLIPSEDGRQIFVFDERGRHLKTLDALTLTPLHTFTYDDDGRLTAAADLNGRLTVIERDTDGAPTALVSPDGLRTLLSVGDDGLLTSVTSPAGETWDVTYHPGGLVETFTDPRGGSSAYDYDADGQLRTAEDAVGAIKTLSLLRPDRSTEEVTFESGEGWKTVHRTTSPDGGATEVREVEPPLGVTVRATTTDGGAKKVIDAADGTHTEITLGPDPRFGMAAPIPTTFKATTPSGVQSQSTFARAATLAQEGDVLSLTGQTDQLTVNGRAYAYTWDRAAGRFSSLSPEGRERWGEVDAAGRLTTLGEDDAVAPLTIGYDEEGRIRQRSQGDVTATVTRDDQGFVHTIEDGAGHLTTYERDDAGRILRVILPSGRTYGFGYDENGNRTSVTMPSGDEHTLGYTAVDLESSYTPPGGDPQTTDHNLDRQRTLVTLASGATVESTWEKGQRLKSLSYDDTRIDLSYDGPSLRPSSLSRWDAGTSRTLELGWDGSLLTRQGAFTYRYDANLFLVAMTLSGDPEWALPRDDDGLLTGQGPFDIERDGPAGRPSLIEDAHFTQTLGYDALGLYAGGVHQVDGATFYDLSLERDAAGRLATRAETLSGSRREERFTYDADGQLLEVWRGDARVERYDYDDNGNRTLRQRGDGPVEVATYDAQDRLLTRGPVTYTHDADGALLTRGADRFTYSPQGELLEADLDGGAVITYRYDALSRPIERDDGGLTTWLYGNPTQPYQLTASIDAEGVRSRYVYDEAGRLFALLRGDALYYVATDAVGSPRLVVDTQGAVVKRVDRDAFGAVLSDSAPDFPLAVGFAGGLEDPDTGLIRFGLRDYDPEAGRWTSRDPIRFHSAQGNLYAYAGNDPLLRRDPLGLFCIGASYYSGVGGGASFCWTKEGMSICGEVGVGVGGGVTVDPWGEVEETRRKVSVQASASQGGVSVGVGGEISYGPCGFGYSASLDASLGYGPASVGGSLDLVTGEAKPTGLLSHDGGAPSSTKLGVQLQASVSAGACAKF